MINYEFDTIIGQRVSFAAAADTLNFATNQANEVRITPVGAALSFTTAAGTVELDATPLLNETRPALLTPDNVTFAGGGLLAVGDLTTDDTLDGDGNLIDFTTDLALISAVNANNQLHGLGGDDTLIAGDGNNIAFGGDGADSITLDNGDNTVFGGEDFADTADGGDSITLGSGNNVVYGNAGGDAVTFSTVTAAGNLLQYFGGLGADSLTADAADGRFAINAGPAGDVITLTNATADNTVFGGGGGDTLDLSGSSGDHTVYGGAAIADSADGGDAITLGSGNAVLYANGGGDTVLAGPGAGNSATLFLGLGADQLTSTPSTGAYEIFSGPGGDNIDLTNHTGSATIFGGNGIVDPADAADTIIGSSDGDNLIYGNAGGDAITVRPGNGQTATVYAGADNDTVAAIPTTAAATLSLFGNTGDDVFALDFTSGAPVANLFDFGLGDNSLEVTLSGGGSAAGLSVTRNAAQTVLQNGGAEQIVLAGFTGNFDDTNYTGSDGSQLLTNFDGAAATLSGSDNNDQLIAGHNGDSLSAGAGDDRLTGGNGNDRFGFQTANFNQGDTITGGSGTDSIVLDTPGTTIDDGFFQNKSGIEVLQLESGDYSANGIFIGSQAVNAGIFSVDATAASGVTVDLSSATQGILYRGGTGADSIISSNFGDAIDGKAGDDTILGNRGSDILRGGEGSDTFVYDNGIFDAEDIIQDFDFGEDTMPGDQLQFNAAEAAYNLGNRDAVVDGAIINSITAAGADGTEIIILKSVAIDTDDIPSSLDIINANVAADRNALNLFFDDTRDQAVMYYDNNGNTSGGHQLLLTFENITSLNDLDEVGFTDFVFV